MKNKAYLIVNENSHYYLQTGYLVRESEFELMLEVNFFGKKVNVIFDKTELEEK